MYSHPETVYPNGSQLFQKLTMEDTGHYSIQIKKKVFRVKKELDSSVCTTNDLSVNSGWQANSISHTGLVALDSALFPPASCPRLGLDI